MKRCLCAAENARPALPVQTAPHRESQNAPAPNATQGRRLAGCRRRQGSAGSHPAPKRLEPRVPRGAPARRPGAGSRRRPRPAAARPDATRAHRQRRLGRAAPQPGPAKSPCSSPVSTRAPTPPSRWPESTASGPMRRTSMTNSKTSGARAGYVTQKLAPCRLMANLIRAPLQLAAPLRAALRGASTTAKPSASTSSGPLAPADSPGSTAWRD